MSLDIKVGDKVISNGTKHSPKGLLGYVTRVEEGFDIEDHGTVEIIVTKLSGPAKKYYKWLKIGDREHFCQINWKESLEIL